VWSWSLGYAEPPGLQHLPAALDVEGLPRQAGPWALLVAVALIARDPRPSIAAAVYAAGLLAPGAYSQAIGWYPALGQWSSTVVPGALLAGSVLATVAILPARRRLVSG
jgi:hypothetical protein